MLLGDVIKKYRKEHNMSLQGFADLINTSRSYIHMLEKNINPSTNKPISPSIETLKLLANAMQMDVNTLLSMLDKNQKIYLDETEFTKQFENNLKNIHVASYMDGNRLITELRIPLLKIKNVKTIFSPENIVKDISFSVQDVPNNGYFAYISEDNLMAPLLDIGDIAIMHKDSNYANKGTYLMRIKKDSCIIGKVVESIDGIDIYVMSTSKPIYEKLQKKDIEIFGKVIKVQNESYFK